MENALYRRLLIPPKQSAAAAKCQEKDGVIPVSYALKKKKVENNFNAYMKW